MTIKLLKSKLEPPFIRDKRVSRHRLIEQLERCRHAKLTLISAPPGFGKTTLLAEWFSGIDDPAGWLSLTHEDNNLSRFFIYFLKAFKNTETKLGLLAQEILKSFSSPDIDAIISTLIDEISHVKSDLFIILDDYHEIKKRVIHDSINSFLLNSPSNMHLVISTRKDPPFPLGKMRARNQLSELRTHDLRFSQDETAIFLTEIMGLTCSGQEVDALEQRTEGWIAGLQLAALSMQKRKTISDVIESFDGSQKHIYDYLMDEVFNNQLDDVQTFLLQTSILDNLSHPLCNAVTERNDSQSILEYLDNANLFIVALDDKRYFYRFHQLFREFLSSRLTQMNPETLQELHLRASKWYEDNALSIEAINHAIASANLDVAADLIEIYGADAVFQGERITALNWINNMPEKTIRSRPLLCILHAWTMIADRSETAIKMMEQRLYQAEQLLLIKNNPQSKAQRWLLPDNQISGYVHVLRVYQAILINKPAEQVLNLSKKAIDLFEEEDPRIMCSIQNGLGLAYYNNRKLIFSLKSFNEAWSTGRLSKDFHSAIFAQYMKANIVFFWGNFDEAEHIIEDTMHSIVRPLEAEGKIFPISGSLHILKGTIEFERNNIDAAYQSLQKGLPAIELFREWGVLVYGYSTMARLMYVKTGNLDNALEVISKIEKMILCLPDMVFLPNALRLELMVAESAYDSGLIDEASRLAQKLSLELNTDKIPPNHFQLYTWQIISRINIVRFLAVQVSKPENRNQIKHLQNELQMLIGLLPQLESEGILFLEIKIHIIQAITFQATGDKVNAVAAIRRALSLSEHKGYRRIFIDEGLTMASLLKQAISEGFCGEYAALLLSAIKKETQAKQQAVKGVFSPELIEQLSKRELEILRLVAAGLSNREIANQLFLALGTVKKHISNIFGKLGVQRRTEALSRSRQLGLL